MSDGRRAMDDIAFLRSLAEEGRDAPLLAGPMLMACGLIFSAASAGAWWASGRNLITNGWGSIAMYSAASVSVMLVMAAMRRRAAAGSGTAANRAARIAWAGVGAAIWTIAIALTLLAQRTGDWRIMTAFPSIIFGIYGSAWMIAAAMTRVGWLWLVAIASFAGAIWLGWVGGEPAMLYPAFAAGIFALVALPGLALTLRARRA